MKNLLISAALLSTVIFSACAGKTGEATLASSDPANTPAAATIDLDSFKAQKETFTLRIKNFKIAQGQWVPGDDIGIVDLERAAIMHLEQAGYAYTPDPGKSRYNIEFHLTCYDPAGGAFRRAGSWTTPVP